MPITPQRIVIKHSYESGAVPDINDLVAGEIALNATDNAIFYRGSDGQLVTKDLDFQSSIVNYVNDTFNSSMLQTAEVNNDGDLIFTYLDNSTANLGNVIGPRGEGIGINGVVDYAINLPLPVADGGGVGDVGILPESLNKTGTIFVVRLGIDPENLFGTTPYDSGDPVLYMYNSAEVDPDLRWFSTGVLQGPLGEPGPPGPVGEVTAESLDQLLDDLGLGPTDIVPVVGLQLSDTGTVALDDGTLGLNSSGELILHNGLANGNELPAIKAGGSLTQATSFVSGTDVYLTDLEYPFKIAEFNIPFNQVSTVGDLLNLNGKISLKFDLINPYQTFVLPDSGIYLVVALDDSVIVSPGVQPYGALYFPYFNKHESNDGNSTFKIESDININIENVDSFAEEISLLTRFRGGIKNTIFKNTQGAAPIVATTYHDEWLDAALGDGSLLEYEQYIPRPVNENAFIKIPIYIVGVDYTGNPARPMYCSSVLNLSKTSKYQTP